MPLFKSRSEFDVPPESPAIVPTNPAALPEGFNDENSEFYVHPDLRAFYRADPQAELEAMAGQAPLLWARKYAATLLPPVDANEAKQIRYAQVDFVRDPAGTQLPTTFPFEWRDLFIHVLRVEAAAAAATRARQDRERKATYDAAHRCQGCETVRADVPAQVASARGIGRVDSPLLPAGARLCIDCLPGAMQRWAAAKDADLIDGRRRGDLLEDWLSRQTRPAAAQRPVVQAS